ncbi:MAG: CDP-alcohol phosphatidyltransferase family protein [Patescibacteria group bacterium]|jgi:CDP-diacylglycerol--glycerol-3-phosphate 3-phosphatidyltransferase
MAQRPFSQLYPHDYIMKYTVIPLIPRWISPNHVTMLRMAMTPSVIWFLSVGDLSLGIPLFVFAAFTDAIDGSLARLRHRITAWGIFFDPVADKILIGGVALTVAIQYFHPALVFSAVALDLLPGILFLSRKKEERRVMSANTWGKIKMVLQFSSLTLLLLGLFFGLPILMVVGEIVLCFALGFALIAAVTYSL